MSVRKYYEISCNQCGSGHLYIHSIKYANSSFKEEGGLIKKGKHFCTKECLNKFERNNFPEK